MNIDSDMTFEDLGSLDLAGIKTGFDPVPSGKYPVRICKVDKPKSTKDGNGRYIPIRVEITEGEYAKRQLFFNLNWPNSEEAKKFFKGTMLAFGYTEAEMADFKLNPDDLMSRKAWANIKVEPYTDDFGTTSDQNRVKGFTPMSDSDVLDQLNG
jgi:hypothetical protein